MNDAIWDTMYLRKSRQDNPHEPLEETLRKHRELLDKLARDQHYHIKDVYEEVVSGESLYARPQMMRLLEKVEQGEYAHVLCVDIQRLGRGSMIDQGIILEAFKRSGTQIVTLSRVYDLADETDETYTEFETFMSRQEYKMIQKRLRRGIQSSVDAGGYLPPAPYGYDKCTIGKIPSLKINSKEAPIVKLIFDMYLQGIGCQKIAYRLCALGAKTKRGRDFTRNSVRALLQNPVYAGKVVWNRAKFIRPGKNGETKHRSVPNPHEQWRVSEGLHPAIITEEQFAQVSDMFAKRMKISGNKGVTVNPLASLVICGNCGMHMQRAAHSRGGPFLLCLNRGCMPMSKLSLVESALLSELRSTLKSLEFSASQKANTEDTTERQRRAVEKQVSIAKAQDAKLHDLLEQGIYDTATFLQRHEALSARIKSFEAELESLLPVKELDFTAMIDRVQNVLDVYQTCTPEEKNHLLKSIIQKVVYHKEKGAPPDGFTLEVFLLPIYL